MFVLIIVGRFKIYKWELPDSEHRGTMKEMIFKKIVFFPEGKHNCV